MQQADTLINPEMTSNQKLADLQAAKKAKTAELEKFWKAVSISNSKTAH